MMITMHTCGVLIRWRFVVALDVAIAIDWVVTRWLGLAP